jgi:hypothetical protein
MLGPNNHVNPEAAEEARAIGTAAIARDGRVGTQLGVGRSRDAIDGIKLQFIAHTLNEVYACMLCKREAQNTRAIKRSQPNLTSPPRMDSA